MSSQIGEPGGPASPHKAIAHRISHAIPFCNAKPLENPPAADRSHNRSFSQLVPLIGRPHTRRTPRQAEPVLNLRLPNDETLPCGFNPRLSHALQRIDFENAFDLSEQPIQQSEVAAGDPDDRCRRFRVQVLVGKPYPGRRPPLFQKPTSLRGG